MKSLNILFTAIIALGVTNVWADLRRMDNSVCSPTIHFKIPKDWARAYIILGGSAHAMPAPDADGWSTVSLADTKLVGTNDDESFYINGVNDITCMQGLCVLPAQFGAKVNDVRSVGFTCNTFKNDGAEVWIQNHPDVKKSGQTYMTFKKPDVKDFYVLLPQNRLWMGATPMIAEDGKSRALQIDEEKCGWYYRRYIDEVVPSNVLIHRDDDEKMSEAIGMNGAWETNPSMPIIIPLKLLFESFDSQEIYFVADQVAAQYVAPKDKGWSATFPDVTGACGYELASTIYDTDASLHGAFTCNPEWSMAMDGTERAKYNACYYSSAAYPINTTGDAAVPCIGVTKGMVGTTIDPKTKKMQLTTKGKACFGSKADDAFAAMFSSTPGVNETYLFNIPFTRTADGKWEFDSDYYQAPGAPVQGGFYPAERSPEDYQMLSARLPAAENKRQAEGPVFFCADNMNSRSASPLGLRTIHPTENVPMSDLICNGSSWDGGIDCEGLFAEGSEFSQSGELTPVGTQLSKKLGVTWDGDGWGWSCGYGDNLPEGWPLFAYESEKPYSGSGGSYSFRWTSGDSDSEVLTKGGRNQHFCFESHAKFRFKKGLKFTIRGDDDIWVYIDNKLAVDLGGTHLAAPNHVVLDKFMPSATVGKIYDIDIFFCDRRTTMSNMRINTDILMFQGEEVFPTINSSSSKEAASSTSKDSKSSSSTGKDVKSSSSKNSKSSSSVKNSKSSSSSKKSTSSSSSKVYSKPTFRVKMVAPFEFDIVFDEDLPTLAKQYAVMDLNGHVLSAGELSGADTRVKIPISGSYIVKVGLGYKIVNVK